MLRHLSESLLFCGFDTKHLDIIYGCQAGDRKLLLDVVPIVWNDTSILMKSGTAVRSSLLRKFLVKLTQRIGLICLPHRLPSWKYKVCSEFLSRSTVILITGPLHITFFLPQNFCAWS